MIDARNSLTRPVDFESIPQNVFAEQLTYMDSVSTGTEFTREMGVQFDG